MERPARLVLVIAVVLGFVALDQATKVIAIRTLAPENRVIAFPDSWYPNDLFRFQYAENKGAFLSLGSRLSDSARFWVLTGLNSVILVLVALYLLGKQRLHAGVTLALALILAGGVGNLIDRVFRDGVVIDFMNLGIAAGPWSVRTGIFNIADLAIVGGLVLLVGLEILLPRTDREAAAEQDTQEG